MILLGTHRGPGAELRHTNKYIHNTKQEAKTNSRKDQKHIKGGMPRKSNQEQEDKLRRIRQANVVGYGALSESVGAHTQLSDVGAISQLSAMNLLSGGGLSILGNAQNSNSESLAKQTEDQDRIFQIH